MNKVAIFDQALKYHNITKKEFAKKSNMPYDTVTETAKELGEETLVP